MLSLAVLDIFAFLLGGVVLVAGGLTPWGDAFTHTLGVVTGYAFARLFRCGRAPDAKSEATKL